MSSLNIFVVAYELPTHGRVFTSTLWTASVDFPSQETNVSFLGRYVAPKHSLLAGLRQNEGEPVTAIPETGVSFIGRFVSPTHSLLPALRQAVSFDVVTAQPNPHFLGRFNAGNYRVSLWLRQNEARDVPAIIQPETNTSFLGRYIAPQHSIPVLLRQRAGDAESKSAFVPETNPHFLGRHTALRHLVLPGFRQTVPNDIAIPSGADPHFLGRFTPLGHLILPLLRQNTEQEGFVAIVSVPSRVVPQVEAIYKVWPQASHSYARLSADPNLGR